MKQIKQIKVKQVTLFLLRADLGCDEVVIKPLQLHQFVVSSHFLDLPLVENHDLVCRLDGGQTVRHDHRCAPLPHLLGKPGVSLG